MNQKITQSKNDFQVDYTDYQASKENLIGNKYQPIIDYIKKFPDRDAAEFALRALEDAIELKLKEDGKNR